MRRLGLGGWWMGAVWLVTLQPLVSGAPTAATPRPGPQWRELEEVVRAHFAALPNHRAGDLITRSQVEPLWERLAQAGWNVRRRSDWMARVSADDGFLATTLRSRSGQQLMRKIAKYPQAYDMLERMAELERGRRKVQDLINTERGDEVIEFLTTTAEGRELSSRMRSAPRGANFARPTHKLYTAETLLAALQAEFAQGG